MVLFAKKSYLKNKANQKDQKTPMKESFWQIELTRKSPSENCKESVVNQKVLIKKHFIEQNWLIRTKNTNKRVYLASKADQKELIRELLREQS